MTSPNQRPPPTRSASHQPPDVPHNAPDAALRGASLAFAKPPVRPKPNLKGFTSNNGALAAATVADRTLSPQRLSLASSPGQTTGGQLSRQSTGGSYMSNLSSTHPSPFPTPNSTLGIPHSSPNNRALSPSNIAATLAAARHTPGGGKGQSELVGNAQPQARMTPVKFRGFDRTSDVDDSASIGSRQASPRRSQPAQTSATDDASIPPTSSLVHLFETKSEPRPKPSLLTEAILVSPVSNPPILSPKPRRTLSARLSLDQELTSGSSRKDKSNQDPEKKPVAPRPKPKPLLVRTQPTSEGDKGTVKQEEYVPSPTPRARPPTSGSVVSAKDEMSSSSSYASAQEYRTEPREKPNVPPPRRAKKQAPPNPKSISSELPNFLQPAQDPWTKKPSTPQLPPVRRKFSVDSEPYDRPASTSNAYQRQSIAMLQPYMTGDSLANAMVGAALASTRSSRTATPSQGSQAPSMPRRGSHAHHHHHLFHHSRTPSPPKVPGRLRTTMREEKSSSSSSDEKHKKTKKIFGKKHPNKHKEGSRKRWRDSITERERKRYEGVWAANRGLHVPRHRSSTAQDEVNNLVTRDIWSRSRLPENILEEIWELVDSRRVGTLDREEFVVGLWLIDQSLKGRKLPTKVGESVWTSVRGVGVKVKVKR